MTAPFFPGIRPHIGSLFATDFSEYEVGAQPFDWREVLNAANFSAVIVATASSPSGKALHFNSTNSSRQLLVWDLPGLAADYEILLRFRKISGGNDYMGCGGRWAWTAANGSDVSGYSIVIADLDGTGSQFRSPRFVNGVETNLGGDGLPESAPAWWIRQRVIGTSIKREGWSSSSAEPPLTEDTDSLVTAPGAIGLFTRSACIAEIDYFAVSLPQGSDPPATIPLPY